MEYLLSKSKFLCVCTLPIEFEPVWIFFHLHLEIVKMKSFLLASSFRYACSIALIFTFFLFVTLGMFLPLAFHPSAAFHNHKMDRITMTTTMITKLIGICVDSMKGTYLAQPYIEMYYDSFSFSWSFAPFRVLWLRLHDLYTLSMMFSWPLGSLRLCS